MKAVKINNNYQVVKEVPREWLDKEVYDVFIKEIGENQKQAPVNEWVVNEDLKTIEIPVLDLTEKEIDKKNNGISKVITDELNSLIASLEVGAKKISIGKEGTREYIETQERIYFRKYQIAKGFVDDYNNLIADEAKEFGYTVTEYKDLIIYKYELGLNMFNAFLSMIERARSKALFLIESKNYKKAREIIALMGEVKTETPVEEIQKIMSEILNY